MGAENFFVWVNEEDQMRIVSMEKGDNILAIFTRFANATETIKDALKSEGYDFMLRAFGLHSHLPIESRHWSPRRVHGEGPSFLVPQRLQDDSQGDEAPSSRHCRCGLGQHWWYLGHLELG